MRSRAVRQLLAITLLCVVGLVSAAASLKLGTVLPAWDELRSGNLHRAASQLVDDYSAQVQHFCVQPEVFLLSSASSIQAARDLYESNLPAASSLRVLVGAADQRVTMVITPASNQEVMAVLALTGSGVVLILC